VLDDARAFSLDADEIAGGVLQEDDRQAGLAAELDELAGLARAGGIDRAVVADEADRAALDRRVAADGLGAIGLLEIEIFRAVGVNEIQRVTPQADVELMISTRGLAQAA